jgi:hypothetical protein
MKFEVEALGVFTPEEVNEFAELFVLQKAPGQKNSPLFSKIIQGRFSKLRRRTGLFPFHQATNEISPPKKDTIPEEILSMVDMDKFRLQEQQNGSIVLNPANNELENTSGDGHKGGGHQEKEKLEVIVKELNERFHFDFEDRDKVISIVIPKLAKDQGLVAAFQTDNLASLQRQKFSESLENAFISSASDFYGVLNRMSAEPDFKRLLTEFALGEFKKGLRPSDPAVETARSVDPIGALADRARSYVLQQFGTDQRWAAINTAVWSSIGERKDFALTLADVDEVATRSSAESDEVLAVLALLSRPSSGFLKMEYVRKDGAEDSTVSMDEVTKQLRAWWREKTITGDAWRSWAGKIIVKWSPADFGGAASAA